MGTCSLHIERFQELRSGIVDPDCFLKAFQGLLEFPLLFQHRRQASEVFRQRPRNLSHIYFELRQSPAEDDLQPVRIQPQRPLCPGQRLQA